MLNPSAVLFSLFIGYFMGSIPFGLLITRMGGIDDLRKIGSGNIGATNVLRTGKKSLAALTLLLDGLKGAAAVLLIEIWHPETAAIAGVAAVLGHVFPLWLGFKGGKGVATSLGVILALSPWTFLIAGLIWLLTAFISRYSSLAAMVSLSATPFVALFREEESSLVFVGFLFAAIALITHRANIQRLLQHTEPKIGAKKNVSKGS